MRSGEKKRLREIEAREAAAQKNSKKQQADEKTARRSAESAAKSCRSAKRHIAEIEEEFRQGYKAKRGDREKIFAWAREEGAKANVELPTVLNNAVVASHRVYRGEPELFDALFARNGGDWKKMIAALKALDRKDPWASLRAAVRG